MSTSDAAPGNWLVPMGGLLVAAFAVGTAELIVGGLFLVWKATREIHQRVDPDHAEHAESATSKAAQIGFAAAMGQIVMLDLVFSIDSVITAVGMAEHLPVMIAAVVIAIIIMLIASGPVSEFVHRYPTVKMLALSFLLLIGMTLIADALHFHIPRGYLYFAVGFSILVEFLNQSAMRRSTGRSGKKH